MNALALRALAGTGKSGCSGSRRGGGAEGGEEGVQLYKYEHEKYNGNHFTHKWIKATRTRSAKCRMQNAASKMKNGKGEAGEGRG